MIVLAILVYAAYFEGMTVAWWAFVLAAIFDLGMADNIFGDD